jgi:DNA-binding NarL/FixJ family response regulator
MTRPRVLLADDHALMLDGLVRLLADDFDIVGTAENGRALIAKAVRLKPDVIMLDVGMPEMNGVEAARRLAKILPSAKIIFVTQRLDRAYLHAAFSAGAMGYVTKQSAATELVEAIRSALRGHYYVPALVGEGAQRFASLDPTKNPAEMFGTRLTPRQREVLQLVAEGKTAKEISTALNISVKTVEFHRNCLMDELGIRTTAQLTRYALARGIVNF